MGALAQILNAVERARGIPDHFSFNNRNWTACFQLSASSIYTSLSWFHPVSVCNLSSTMGKERKREGIERKKIKCGIDSGPEQHAPNPSTQQLFLLVL